VKNNKKKKHDLSPFDNPIQ